MLFLSWAQEWEVRSHEHFAVHIKTLFHYHQIHWSVSQCHDLTYLLSLQSSYQSLKEWNWKVKESDWNNSIIMKNTWYSWSCESDACSQRQTHTLLQSNWKWCQSVLQS